LDGREYSKDENVEEDFAPQVPVFGGQFLLNHSKIIKKLRIRGKPRIDDRQTGTGGGDHRKKLDVAKGGSDLVYFALAFFLAAASFFSEISRMSWRERRLK
jgi:hypothetical protein